MPKQGEAVTITQCDTIPRLRVSTADIDRIKRGHILANLLYTPEEAGHVLGKSPRSIKDLVKEGKLVAADDKAKKGEHGLVASNGLRIVASSVESYRKSITIPPEKWSE